jgi:hypothetical protein
LSPPCLNHAPEQRIRSLYHYQAFDDPGRLARILIDGAVYCSNPKDFNDPWDCRPCFSKKLLDEPAQYERVVQWFIGSGRRRDPSISDAEHSRREQVLRNERARLEWMIDQMTASIEHAMYAQYRVYCLSTHADSPLMWSHYARSHHGVCLEFSVQNTLFCASLPVEYLDRYPEVDLTDDSHDGTLRTFLTKSKDWSYEHEFRLVVAAPGFAFPDLPATKDNFVPLPTGALKAVIMGCLMPERDRELIRSLVKDVRPSVVLKEAHRIANHYALDIRNVD